MTGVQFLTAHLQYYTIFSTSPSTQYFSTTPSTQIMENLMENLNILNKRVDEIKLAEKIRSAEERENKVRAELQAYKDSNNFIENPKDSKGRENVDIQNECKNCQTLLSTLKVSNKIIQEYNSKLKQINALQRQPPINNPVQQTKPHLQYKQNSNGIKKRVEVKIKELEPCILCKGDHGLWNCPKIDDVKRGTLKMPPNICYQHCNIRSSRCQNPCKGKLTFTKQNGDTNEIDVLCSIHGKYHRRLCKTGICKDKIFQK